MPDSPTSDTTDKLYVLKRILAGTGGCAVAFSGGVDSSLLITVAREVLGDRCLAVIATSSTYTEREYERAAAWIEETGIPYVVISSEELDIPEFSSNPSNRCYFCKKELFEKVREQAENHGLPCIADGSNADDAGDHRPGLQAASELKVLSPLKEAGMTKNDIRCVARYVYDLPMADKPAMACLASRFPYGSMITAESLGQIERVESMLESQGFHVYRARHHGDILRLELGPEEMARMGDDDLRRRITLHAKEQGFAYVTIDIEGYRSGSMNEVLNRRDN